MSLSARKRRIHFIGIGGIGMSGIAELLLKLGHDVGGSDRSDSETVLRLRSLGAQVAVGHTAENVLSFKPDVVVYSTAVDAKNPELVAAREQKIPIIRRAEMLAELMRLKRGVAIAGSHGKTTTTGLVSLLVKEAGLDPTVVIGGKFDAIGSNAAWGGGEWLIAEADESDGSFLRLQPEIAVVTNIDREHMDHYKNFDAALKAFEDFLDNLPFYGRAILSSDCPRLRSLQVVLRKPRIWYGFEIEHQPDCLIRLISEGRGSEFELYNRSDNYKKAWLKAKLSVPGRHNVSNATAAVLTAMELGVAVEKLAPALEKFHGVSRRFEKRGEWRGRHLIEDYAHHPTEIRATLQAAIQFFGGIKPIVVFQPHRFTRTRDQWSEFSSCFEVADRVYTLPIYAASEPREAWVEKLDGDHFAKNITGPKSMASQNQEALLKQMLNDEKSWPKGAPIFILGAGDVPKIISKILNEK